MNRNIVSRTVFQVILTLYYVINAFRIIIIISHFSQPFMHQIFLALGGLIAPCIYLSGLLSVFFVYKFSLSL